jgi:heterodisulfide reductase subunit B
MYFPYYYHKIQDWSCGYVVRYYKNMETLSNYRKHARNSYILKNKHHPSMPLITHCSYCFKELEQYKNEINSFSHQEFNKPPYTINNLKFMSHY